jgi:hypothetical protein
MLEVSSLSFLLMSLGANRLYLASEPYYLVVVLLFSSPPLLLPGGTSMEGSAGYLLGVACHGV